MGTRSELNAQIALYFGFKRSDGKQYLIDGLPQWTYPDEWYLSQGSIPNTAVPDFLQILEDYLKLMKQHDYWPRERFEE